MSRFYEITQEEMEKFLLPQGFQRLLLPGTAELVYGKIIKLQEFRLSLRIYTAINPNGLSREKGSDAIRIQLYWKYEDTPVPVGKALKCLRVKSWQANMSKAISHCCELKTCPGCKAPMVHREGPKGEFWGCATWTKTKCPGKAEYAKI